MSKAIQGAAMLGGAVAMGVATFMDPALLASPMWDKLMTSLVLGGISMEAGAIAGALTSNRGMAISTRQPAAMRQIIYGERRIGGVEVYRSTTGSKHDQFNYVIVLAGHEIDSIVNLYLDGRQVYWKGSGVGWCVRNGVGFGGIADNADHVGPGGQKYNFGGTGHSGIYCEARFGDQTSPFGTNYAGKAAWDVTPGSLITGLTANDPNWASAGGLAPWVGGCCYVYLKIEYNTDLFPSPPEIKFTVRGKNDIYDPRTGTRGYTKNWALIVGDVLTDTKFGLGDVGSVNEAQLVAAANVCDEMVPLKDGRSEARYECHSVYDSAVGPGDALQQMMPAAAGRLSRIGGEWYIWPAYWQGPSFSFDDSILTGPVSWNPTRSLRELANRVKGTYIAANSPYNVAGNLYDANGWYNGSIANEFPYAFQPTNYPQYARDIDHGFANDAYLEQDSGVLGPWDSTYTYDLGDTVTDVSGVIWKSLMDVNLDNDPATHGYTSGAVTAWASGTTYAVGDAVARSGQEYISLVGSNVGNDPASSPTDWAIVAWRKWANLLPLEVTQSCVLSVAQAQRVAKIMLMRNRQQGSGTFPVHLKAWETQPLDVMQLSFTPHGWSGKQLEIVSTKFFLEEQDGAQAVRFQVAAQETSETVYEWDAASEELSPAGVTGNPTSLPYSIDPPTAMAVVSNSSTAYLGADGQNHPRLLVTWTDPLDVRITQIAVFYRVHGDTAWIASAPVAIGVGSAYISGVISGTAYDVMLYSVSRSGSISTEVEVDNVTASAPNSLVATYTNAPVLALTQPTSTTIAVAAVAVTFGVRVVNYAARTLTISAPSVDTWYYVTIADATQAGESGSPTLTTTASTSNTLCGVLGNTYLGAILAKPAGSATRAVGGGWPAPVTVQVI